MSSNENSLAGFGENQAAAYDQRFAKLAPLREALYLMMKTILADLPADARILCVGAGTGLELAALSQHFPGWRFTAVEPSTPMLKICQQRVDQLGITSRCNFHGGYLDSLPPGETFDAATSLLVSQFVLEREQRRNFFRQIAARLQPGGYLVSSDLAGRIGSEDYEHQLDVWLMLMEHAGIPSDMVQNMRTAYGRDVSILPPEDIGALIASSGFEEPVHFLQTMMIHGWFTRSRTDR